MPESVTGGYASRMAIITERGGRARRAGDSRRERALRPGWARLAAVLAIAAAGCTSPGGIWSGAPERIAHRGNSSVAPENTLASVRSALALEPPPQYVEIDVHRSSDGTLVVIHDATLDRTTNARGRVAQLAWGTIRQADAGYSAEFGDAFRGERVPALHEVLDAVAATTTSIMIEVKAHGIGDRVARLVADRGELARHVIASFHADVLVAASLAAPKARTLYLASDAAPEEIELAARIEADIVGLGHEGLTAAAVHAAHEKGLAVWAWTVNEPERAAELYAMGVDGVISDRVGSMP